MTVLVRFAATLIRSTKVLIFFVASLTCIARVLIFFATTLIRSRKVPPAESRRLLAEAMA